MTEARSCKEQNVAGDLSNITVIRKMRNFYVKLSVQYYPNSAVGGYGVMGIIPEGVAFAR